jgi:hypothetical protein
MAFTWQKAFIIALPYLHNLTKQIRCIIFAFKCFYCLTREKESYAFVGGGLAASIVLLVAAAAVVESTSCTTAWTSGSSCISIEAVNTKTIKQVECLLGNVESILKI